MSEKLIIRDGNGVKTTLQVTSGSNGYIANHTMVSTVQTASVTKYYTGSGGFDWCNSNGIMVADYDRDRMGLVINNDTTDIENGKLYILLGSNNSFTAPSKSSPPAIYSFALDAGGLYIADASTAALKHSIYVASSSFIADSSSMSVLVTLIT